MFGLRIPTVFTPLHEHSRDGNLEEVINLLRTGADINQDDNRRKTPLHYACMEGRLDVAKTLIEAGAPVETEGPRGMKPLHYACQRGHVKIVKFLIERGSYVNAAIYGRINKGWMPLHFASALGNIELVNLLLESGAGITFRDRAGNTALHVACEKGRKEVVELLLKAGADVDSVNKEGRRYPIHSASQNGHLGIVRKLIEFGAQINILDSDRKTPLCMAVCNGHKEVAEVLLALGATSNCKSKQTGVWGTPCCCISLSYVCKKGCVGVARRLLEEGAKIDEKGVCGYSPLHSACENGSVELVKMLLELKPDLESKTMGNTTPFDVAGFRGHKEVMKALVDAGAKVSETSYTAALLLDMCYRGDMEMVEKLLNAGANVDGKDSRDSKTPLHAASQLGNLELLKFLLQSGATSINAQDASANTPLHHAAKSGREEIVKLLIESGAEVNERNHKGESPLHHHCEAGNIDSVRILIQNGALAHLKNCRGDTPLHVVRGVRSSEIIKLLLNSGEFVREYYRKIYEREIFEYASLERQHAFEKISKNSSPRHCRPFYAVDWTSRMMARERELLARYDVSDLVDLQDFQGHTPLHGYCGRINLEAVEILITAGADVHKKDFDLNTVLHHVFENLLLKEPIGSTDEYSCNSDLISAGAKPHEMDLDPASDQTTDQHSCPSDLLEVLLQCGVDASQKNNFSETPLHVACKSGDVDAVKILLKYGANAEDSNGQGLKPIHVAGIACMVHAMRLEVVKVLLDNGVDVDGTDGRGRTLLHHACKRGDLELVKILLANGSNANRRDEQGKSALHFSVMSDSLPDLLKILLLNGAYVNLQDASGNTILHLIMASPTGLRTDIVEFVVEAGANVNLKNNDKKIPFNEFFGQCRANDVFEITKYLLEAGMNVHALDKRCFIRFASFEDRILSLLLDYGAEYEIVKYKLNIYGTLLPELFYPDRIYLEKKHLIKLEVAALEIPESLKTLKSLNDAVSGVNSGIFISHCEDELQRMRNESIGDSSLTYDLVLGQDLSILPNQLPWSLTSETCCQKFPIYGHIIYSRYMPFKRAILMDYCNTFFEMTELPWLPPECMMMVLEYLTNKDLKNMAEILDTSKPKQALPQT